MGIQNILLTTEDLLSGLLVELDYLGRDRK